MSTSGTTTAATPESGDGSIRTSSRHHLMLPILLVGQAMGSIDTSIVNVAAPALRQDLGISGALLQMAIAGYVLAYAVLLISGARVGEIYGYRRVFIVGATIFTAASLVCGIAPDTVFLIVARVIQGVGAAAMVPQVLSLIQRQFEGVERARAVGYYSMVMALGAALGQLLGGIIVTADIMGLSWRAAFLINVPVGVLLLVCAPSVLPALRGQTKRALDFGGVVVLSLSMLMVVVPLTFGHEVHWQTWVWVSLVLGIIGLGAFVLYEQALARRGRSPLLDLGVFLPSVKAGLAVVALGFLGYGGKIFTMALYLQSGLGFSPLMSGLIFTAYPLGFGTANLNWARLPPVLLRWTPTAALIAMTGVEVMFAIVAMQWGWTPELMLPLLFVSGLGQGLAFGPVVNQMASRVRPTHAPVLSGLVTTTVQLSIVVGIATLGTLYLATTKATIPARPSLGIAYVTMANAAIAAVAAICSLRLTTSE